MALRCFILQTACQLLFLQAIYLISWLIGWLCRVLDVCHTNDVDPYLFVGDIKSLMLMLMSSLPHLTHLDISGTNLAGWVREEPMSHRPTAHTTKRCVRSLAYAVNYPFAFLGWLFNRVDPIKPVSNVCPYIRLYVCTCTYVRTYVRPSTN